MDCFPLLDWLYTTIIGFLVVSYWRCTWVLMDIGLCDQHSEADLAGGDSFCYAIPAIEDDTFASSRHSSASISYLIGIICLILGVFMMWTGLWLPNSDNDTSETQTQVTTIVSVRRFFIVYVLGFSCVNIWRGIWYWADDWILPNRPVASYWLCSLVGAGVAFLLQGGNSLLAPPAIFLLDGPGLSPPPIAVTLLSSHYEVTLPYNVEPPQLSLLIRIIDILVSFGLLPFAVVWFWRGTWLLFDNYFYGFTPDVQDVYMSLLWNTIFAILAIGLTSEPVVGRCSNSIPSKDSEKSSTVTNCMNGTLLRLRTYVLAWGTVSFWRVVWLIWDEFLGGTTVLSCCLGHFLSIGILMGMGCLSSITAPASTMGVDSVPHPMAADAPLFANVPIPYDLLYAFGIGRQPLEDDEPLYEDQDKRGGSEIHQQEVHVMTKIDEGDDEEAAGSSSIKKEEEAAAEVTTGEEIEMVPTSSAAVATKEGEGEGEGEGGHNKRESYFEEDITGEGGTAARRPTVFKGPPKGGKYSSRTASAPPRIIATESKIAYLSKRSYGEMQRPGVGSSRKCYSEIAMRPSDDNKRKRSKFFRSR